MAASLRFDSPNLTLRGGTPIAGPASGGTSEAGMVGSMNLDPHTLFVVTISVDAMLGMLLLFAWFQNAQIRAVAWWGAALFLRACAVALFGLRGGAVPELISAHLATTLLLTTFGLT